MGIWISACSLKISIISWQVSDKYLDDEVNHLKVGQFYILATTDWQ